MAVIQRVGSPAKPRKWMSVHEMGDMLGLKKTDRYWLVHKNYFRTETLLGKMRVEIASFEKWYANQDWYHKVNGEAPGTELRLRSYSPKEIQEMLGTDNATVYEILKKNNIETVTVNERLRVPTDAFWDWYRSQSRYRTQEDRKKDAAAEAASLSMPEMARLLDVPRSTVYGILSSKKYAPLLDVIVIAGRRRVTRESFERFLQAQDTYELFNFEYEELELEEKREYENYKRRCLAEADYSQEKKRLEYLTGSGRTGRSGACNHSLLVHHRKNLGQENRKDYSYSKRSVWTVVIEAEGKGDDIAWLRYKRKITNIVSYITVKIQMESGNRSGKRMIRRTQPKSEKQKLN